MGLLITYALLSIFFSFLCSILEAAFLSFTPTFIQVKKNEGNAYAGSLEALKKDVDKPLIAILTINTVAHTVGAIMVGVQAEKVFTEGGSMVGIVSAIMTFAILVLSEIIPKTIGARHWKKLGKFTASTLHIFIVSLKYTGILWLMLQITKLIGSSGHEGKISRKEYLAMTDAAAEEGVFEENETALIKNTLLFKSVKAEKVMTPFSVAVIANEEISIEEFYSFSKDIGFSRIPVFNGKRNNISGFILKDQVLQEVIENRGKNPLSSIKKHVPIVSNEISISDLFKEFVHKRSHIAVIVDEYGNTVGLVTMEDIIETLFGLEIMDESDDTEDMQVLARENWEKRTLEREKYNDPGESDGETK